MLVVFRLVASSASASGQHAQIPRVDSHGAGKLFRDGTVAVHFTFSDSDSEFISELARSGVVSVTVKTL